MQCRELLHPEIPIENLGMTIRKIQIYPCIRLKSWNYEKQCLRKFGNDHLVTENSGSSIIYIDRHLIHEVTSPQAFESLRLSNRKVRRPEATFATMDHNVSTQ